jgi:DNA polymerase-1
MTVKRARRTGEVRTLLNRVRKLPGINNQNSGVAKRAERQAVNSVIQGSAADLVKLAMIKIDSLIKKNENDIGNSRLMLQIHDELGKKDMLFIV